MKERGEVWVEFRVPNNEVRIEDFDLGELVGAVRLSHGSAAGPGEVCCLMLKHLLESSLEAVLGVFNCIWTAGGFPGGWTYATVIPIPRPGGDLVELNNSFDRLSM